MQWKEFRSHIRHLSAKNLQRVEDAFELGKEMHKGQKRKSREPYFTHPTAVADMLADMGADADTIIAALLHDTIEDTPLTLKEVKRQFGNAVATMVDGVTKLDEIEGKPGLDIEVESLRKIFTLMQEDVRIMAIKLVDRLHNMQTIEFCSEKRQELQAQETMDVYVKIADRLCMWDLRDELEHLCCSILYPKMAEKISVLRPKNENAGQKIIGKMKKEIKDSGNGKHIEDIQYERKPLNRIRSQIEKCGDAPDLSFMTAVFVCPSIAACYETLGILHQIWPRELLSFQDFINTPQANGYRGVHTTIILENGIRVRCKIRTKEMHEYARKGIATKCFDSEAIGLLDYLPWTQHISPLAKDTANLSEQFWQNLQNDILGESIVIHGPGGETVMVPKDATALDGAFYCIGEKALCATAIRLDAGDVSFQAPLKHGISIEISLGSKKTVKRDWLDWVHTGIATAAIRNDLAGERRWKKVLSGQELLQEAFTIRGGGYLKEFGEETMEEKAKELGYESPDDLYVSIADGHVDPTDVARSLASMQQTILSRGNRTLRCTMTFSFEKEDDEVFHRLHSYLETLKGSLASVRTAYPSYNRPPVLTLRVVLPPDKIEELHNNLRAIGATNIEISRYRRVELWLLAGVIGLWGINPVIARWFLYQGIPPISLLTIRLFSFAIFAAVFFLAWRLMHRTKYSPIPNATLLSILPAIGLFCLPLFTYLSLIYTPPSIHLTILRLNTLLLPFYALIGQKKLQQGSKLFLALFATGASIAILLLSGVAPPVGIGLSLLALLSYSFYSLATERVLQTHQIGARYPQIFLRVSLILGALGIAVLPLQDPAFLTTQFTLPIVLYVLFFVFIPYIFFQAVLRHVQFRQVTDFFSLEVPIALLAEIFILDIRLPPWLYPILLGILGTIFVLRWKKFQYPAY